MIAAFGPVEQAYLLEARQMQAMSFVVHIPLVCFGIAFPAMVLRAEWLWMRTGDEVYRVLAMRWTKVMVALFACGVVTGTILSFEMGLLWPGFMGTFGAVFGLGFALEGFSFFVEAIFIGIYVYGWNRMAPRAHFLCGIPIVIAGMTGSLFVLAVNAWMNAPTGFRLVDGEVTDIEPLKALFGNGHVGYELVHMYLAGFIVTGFLVAGAYAVGRLRGRWGRYERIALTIPLTVAALAAPVQVIVGDWVARRWPRRSRRSSPRSRASGTPSAERRCTSAAGIRTARSRPGSRSRRACRCSPSTTRTPRCRGSTRCPRQTGRR